LLPRYARQALTLALLCTLLAACGSGDAASPARTYVALGASDAVGVGADDPETEGWVSRLHASMPAGTRLVNLGVSGSTLSEALAQQLPVALAAEPDVVTVWLAVNDERRGVPLERYARDLDELLGRLRATGALVLVGNLPDLTLLPGGDPRGRPPEALRAEIARWNAAIARIARARGAVLLDLHSAWRELESHSEYLGADGFHPSTLGHARLSELWRDRLRAAGAGK
jgi:lysophospholipase L1-like esterase